MSCYSCGTSFGAFKKEHGCKNCGYAFCKNCLPYKIEIPKLKNEKHRVCVKCYNIMTGKVKPKEDPARYSPPENFKKRVAALKEREAAGGIGVGHHGRTAHLAGPGVGAKAQHRGMSQTDLEIQQRLEKLKEKTPQEIAAAKVTADEIDDRLAKLKGMDPSRYKKSNKPTYFPPDRRTQQEQLNDLLDEISQEVELDSKLPDPTLEIEDRLARLKEKPPDTQKQPEEEDSDENNLNKASMKDSQTFSQNISNNNTGKPASNTTTVSPGKDTSEEQSDDTTTPEDVKRILNEAAQELEQDAQKALRGLQQDKDIMKKLQDIKQRRKQSSNDINRDENFEDSNSENEDDVDEAAAEGIIKQALEEAKLDEAVAKDGVDTSVKAKKDGKKAPTKKSNIQICTKDDEWYDPDELPYCCICTEDAAVRCVDCDMDLYCNKCFSEGHKELGLTDHRSKKYTPPVAAT